MSVFIIGDLHLSFFPGADKPMDVFGPRWYDHAGRIERNWRSMIREEDTVILAGDISWALKLEDAKYDLDWIDALPGKKVLLKGNHDLWWSGITKLNRMYSRSFFLQNDCYYAEGLYICGSRGWITPDHEDFREPDEKIMRRELLRLENSLKRGAEEIRKGREGVITGVLHFPPVSDTRSFSAFQKMFEDYGVKDVYYGHIHGEDGFRGAIRGDYHGIRYHLVSADFLNCCPLKIR